MTEYNSSSSSICIPTQLWQAGIYCERIEICIVNEGEPLIACSEIVGVSQHEKISKHFISKPCKKEGTSAK